MSTLVQKLQIRPEMTGGVFRSPADVNLGLPGLNALKKGTLDYIVVFVTDAADIERFAAAAVGAIREDGLLWFCYPKKSGQIHTDIHRDTGWAPVLALGFAGCRQIAIDDDWSALRFREPRFSRKQP